MSLRVRGERGIRFVRCLATNSAARSIHTPVLLLSSGLSILWFFDCIAWGCGVEAAGSFIEKRMDNFSTQSLAEEILATEEARVGCQIIALVSRLTDKCNEQLSENDVKEALQLLSQRGLAQVNGDDVRLSEPDQPEQKFYPKLMKQIRKQRMLNALGVNSARYVFQDTSVGGEAGHGQQSKPDLTLAFVQNSRFERRVELITFEVKNRRGADRRAVMDPVAHGAISHNPYLVCPNSTLEPLKIDEIRNACDQHSVGLILFDVEIDKKGEFQTKNLKLVCKPRRRQVEQKKMDRYIEGRLETEKRNELIEFLKVDENGRENS